jgi:hypothetical protein
MYHPEKLQILSGGSLVMMRGGEMRGGGNAERGK